MPAAAQQTTGNIQGRIIDTQKARRSGRHRHREEPETGFTRSEVTDAEGVYRLNALPVGTYDLHAELSGFAPYDRKASSSTSAQTVDAQHRPERGAASPRASASRRRRR